MQEHIQNIKNYLQNLQQDICQQLETFEPEQQFLADEWQRKSGGGGVSRVLEGGQVWEKAGVNFSHVYGENMPGSATAVRPELEHDDFTALGVSLVIHPRNPYVPTTHANVRYFEAQTRAGKTVWWFGGGYDLTPYYGFAEDCQHWHNVAKSACDPFGADVYSRYKKWCDDYFYLPHRKEARGVGGLFFDDLNCWDFATCERFMHAVGDSFLTAYLPIVKQRQQTPYTEREQAFQHYRRGRYVEYNLLYDRGTSFGLQSSGRTESILMSLPPQVTWRYDYAPEKGTPEAALYRDFLVAKDWI